MALLLISGLTLVSCVDSVNDVSNTNDRVELERILSEKLQPGMTVEDWGMTMEEFETAYNAAQMLEKSGSATQIESTVPTEWESEFGTGLQLGDDDCQLIDLGFSFTFYGNEYNEVWVNTNGNLTFNECNTRFWPTNIPDDREMHMIGTLYGDFGQAFEPDTVDWNVYVNTIGTAPERTFVVTWYKVKAWGWPGTNTFQAQLHEGSGNILFAYNGLSANGYNNINGTEMNIGISGGTEYVNTATAEEIPSFDGSNICYKPESGGYREILGGCNGPGPDITRPVLNYHVENYELWPPDHTMRLAVSNISATDDRDSDPQLYVTVEKEKELRKSNSDINWNVVRHEDGTVDVYLRAERNGNEPRVYTVIIGALDESGNKIEERIKITVPHSNGSK